jgi:shikimate dehydrogenase
MPGPAEAGQWPSAATVVVGVIGHPVAHSLSPRLHNAAFAALGLDWVSVGFPVPPGQAAEALVGLRALGLAGLSVTMPFKDEVAALVDRRSPVAERLGAVNCVVRRPDGLEGHNTDGRGFVESLARGARFNPAGRSCLVAGAGGAARAVVLALAESGAAEVVVVNRTPARAEAAAALAGPAGRVGTADDARRADLVVDATPVGMGGAPGDAGQPGPGDPGDLGDLGDPGWLVDPASLRPGQVAAHLVYHPRVTGWLAAAARAGATPVGGLGMLVHQAAAQLRLWTDTEPPVEAMWRAVDDGAAQAD